MNDRVGLAVVKVPEGAQHVIADPHLERDAHPMRLPVILQVSQRAQLHDDDKRRVDVPEEGDDIRVAHAYSARGP